MVRAITLLVVLMMAVQVNAQEPTEIGGRLELMVDNSLIESISGEAELEMHRPVRREIVFRTDAEWEGNSSLYGSVFRDGEIYRMYYRGTHYRHSGEPAQALEDHPYVLCYAVSDDGVTWRRPSLGIHEFRGSTANNIVLTPESVSEIDGDPAHTATWLDTNPDCPPDERIKITILGHEPRGLYVLGSGDGVNFRLLSDQPAVTEGAFDSQNLMFYDRQIGAYREYHRGFHEGVRSILTSVSDDVLDFPEPQWVQYVDSEPEHLYTNQIQPYYRAPHILMGFPMRYTDRGWSQPVLELPELHERRARASASRRYGTAVTDALFMTSRDGLTFNRRAETFIRPGPRERDSWVYGDNFVFWQMVETASPIEDAPNVISLYATEGYWEGTDTAFRRYTMRVDGFASASAPMAGGEVVTKPLIFEGGNLSLNLATSGAGSLRVEIQEPDGTPIPGYTLADCPEIYGDHLRFVVRWATKGGDVRDLEGRPVRLRFVLRDADLYSYQFVRWEPEPEYPDMAEYGMIPQKDPDREPFTVVQDDFEAYEAGTTPTEEDFDPANVGRYRTGWVVREQSIPRVQVLDDAPPGSGSAGDNQHVKITRRDESHDAGGALWAALSPRDAADSTDGIVEVSARLFVPSGNASPVDIDALAGAPAKWGSGRAFHVRLQPDGRVTYYHADEHHTAGELAVALDQWHDVAIRAEMAEGIFDLTVDGETVEGLPFAEDNVNRVQSISFAPNANNTTLYVDDVTVRVMP
jgi:hypothetical protein